MGVHYVLLQCISFRVDVALIWKPTVRVGHWRKQNIVGVPFVISVSHADRAEMASALFTRLHAADGVFCKDNILRSSYCHPGQWGNTVSITAPSGADFFSGPIWFDDNLCHFGGCVLFCWNDGLYFTCHSDFSGELRCRAIATIILDEELGMPCNLSSAGYFEEPICDALPWRPAEVSYHVVLLLQRQNLLPGACGFANTRLNVLCPARASTLDELRSTLSLPSDAEQVNGHEANHSWMYWRLSDMQYQLDSLLHHLLCWLWTCTQSCGEWWRQFFTFLTLMAGRYLYQLLFFALKLKGGPCNADNLLRGSRTLCSGCPQDAAVGLSKFSPRLSFAKQPRKTGFSADLWLFLVLLCTICPAVSAGAGSRHHVDSTGFRASRRSRKLSSAIYNLRAACRHLDSPDTPEDNPDGQPPDDPPSESDDDWDFATESFLFQFYAFGCLPANTVCSFLVGISLQEAIDQISVDAIVPVHDETGVLIPAKGVPFRESVTLLWRPDWLVASRNHVLFVDASMLGKYSFVIQYHGFSITYAALAAQLQPIWEEELDYIHVFVPFFSQEPMQEHTRLPASDGLTVVLQRDAVMPACILDPLDAFKQYKLWGMDVEQVAQPPADLRWPVDKVQMSFDSETGLFSIGSHDPTLPVFVDLASRFVHGVDEQQIVMASLVPDRHTRFGEPVSHLAAVSTSPLQQDVVCVFLVLRGIGLESRSAWLPRSDLVPTQILSALDLDIAFIPDFRVNVTGGTRQNGRLRCRNGDVLFFCFVPDDEGQETSESEPQMSDCNGDESDSEHHGLREPHDSAEAAASAKPSNAPPSDYPGGREGASGSQQSSNGHDSSMLVDMWSHGFSFSDAMRIGDRGDTSANNVDYPARALGTAIGPRTGRIVARDTTPARQVQRLVLEFI